MNFPLWLALPMRAYIGFRRPERRRVLGQELAGVVEAVGPGVTRFKEGEAVFGTTGFRFGSYAEYNCLPAEGDEGVLDLMPENTTFAEAASIPTGGLEAVHFLKLANIQPGEKVLVNGAGGSIGTVGIQLARHYQAQVTAVDRVEKHGLLSRLGAEVLIDYRKENFTQRGEKYDVIFDVIGKAPFRGSIAALKPGGRYLLANPNLSGMVLGPLVGRFSDKKVIANVSQQTRQELLYLKELIESGVIRPVVDRSFPLEQAAEAHRYVQSGQKRGNVVIEMAGNISNVL